MTEALIREAFDRGDFRAATTRALDLYGGEIYGWLAGMMPSPDDADDAFSVFAERLFVGMDRFRWACSMRTWAYRLAHNARRDVRRASKADRHQPIPTDAAITALVARLRTATATFMRDDKKEAFARLRDELPEDDRELLVLRVDRGLEWIDLARVFLDGETSNDEDLKREAARLRKRFQLVKEKLREEGRSRGLIKDQS